MPDQNTTTKEEWLGILHYFIAPKVSEYRDLIDVFTWGNVKSHKHRDFTDSLITFANEVTERDDKGAYQGGNHNANILDGSATAGKYKLPNSPGIDFTIPVDKCSDFGINGDMMTRRLASANVVGLMSNEKIKPVITDFIDKLRNHARQQTIDFFINIGTASAKTYQKAFGILPLVGDASDRPDNFNYGNKGITALSTTDKNPYKAMVNTFEAFQVNVNNYTFGVDKVIFLLHASDPQLAADVFTGEKVRNIQERQYGDNVIPGKNGMKATGSYYDSANPDNFIGVGDTADIARVYHDDGINDSMGFRFEIKWDTLLGATIYGFISGDIVCLNPNGIYKGIVPVAP